MIDYEWKFGEPEQGRCINLDWLEVYCTEGREGYPHDANYFINQGITVHQRDYGTRQYKEMFTLLDRNGMAFCEIRRAPVSESSGQCQVGIYNPYSCHIKLSNRYCYHPQAVRIFADFLMQHHFTVERLFRLDLALDFEKFDRGDDPNKVMQRYVAGRYSKINQSNLSAHARDWWDGREWNYLSWGSENSMVSTKFYDKTLELREGKDKPYIRYAWQAAGLIDDYRDCTKIVNGEKTQPRIYRVEFSIKSSARGWFVVEDNRYEKKRRLVQNHSLGDYETKQQQLHAFANLAEHYFHFKVFEAEKRKDRCKDKILFEFNLNHKPYKLDHLMTETPKRTELDRLLSHLQTYKLLHSTDKNRQAIDLLITDINTLRLRNEQSDYWDKKETLLLQLLINKRIQSMQANPLQDDIELIKHLLNLSDKIF